MKFGLKLQDILGMGINPPQQPFGLPPQGPYAGAPQMGAPPIADLPPMQQQQERPGFFKPGGMGRHLAGAIGDALLQQGGMAPAYAPAMQQKRQAEQAEAQWHKQRQASNEDWRAREEWKLANTPREPRAGTSMMQNYEFLKTINPAMAEEFIRNQTTAPPVVMNNPDGTRTIYPAGAIPQGSAPATLPPDFDFDDEGGPASAPGNFRP